MQVISITIDPNSTHRGRFGGTRPLHLQTDSAGAALVLAMAAVALAVAISAFVVDMISRKDAPNEGHHASEAKILLLICDVQFHVTRAPVLTACRQCCGLQVGQFSAWLIRASERGESTISVGGRSRQKRRNAKRAHEPGQSPIAYYATRRLRHAGRSRPHNR